MIFHRFWVFVLAFVIVLLSIVLPVMFVPAAADGAGIVDFPNTLSIMGSAIWEWSCGTKSGQFVYGTIPDLQSEGNKSITIRTSFDSLAQIVGGFDEFVITLSSPGFGAATYTPAVYVGGKKATVSRYGSVITLHTTRDDLHSTNIEIKIDYPPNGYIQIVDCRLVPSANVIINHPFTTGSTATGSVISFPYTENTYYDFTLSAKDVRCSYITVEISGEVMSFAAYGNGIPLPVTCLSYVSDITRPENYRATYLYLIDCRSCPDAVVRFNVRCTTTPFVVGQPYLYPDSAIDDDRFFLAVWFSRIWETLQTLTGEGVNVEEKVGPAVENQQKVDDFQESGFNDISSGTAQVSSGITGGVSRLGPTLTFCSSVLNASFDSLGDFQLVYTLPIFIGIFCYACGRVVSSIGSRPKSSGSSGGKSSGGKSGSSGGGK